jgi:hypothetical protein
MNNRSDESIRGVRVAAGRSLALLPSGRPVARCLVRHCAGFVHLYPPTCKQTQAAPPGQALGLFQDPTFSSVLTITAMSFSTEANSKLMATQRLERLWNPSAGINGGGSFSSVSFLAKFAVSGTAEGIVDTYRELGATVQLVGRGDNMPLVASLIFVDEIRDRVQMAWSESTTGG